jgi:hypothetical protein
VIVCAAAAHVDPAAKSGPDESGGCMGLFVECRAASRSRRGRGFRHGGRALVACLVLAWVSPAAALFLDSNRDFEIRARAYTEGVLAAENSEPQTRPARAPFQLISHRNFFNPEFDAKLTRYQPFHLDDMSFRLALWGFYDGIYDYGTSQYLRGWDSLQGRITQGHTLTAPITRTDQKVSAWKTYVYQPDPVLGSYGEVPFRINESYLNLSKGPLFVRVGRQAISWGESDTVALLDANDPFDITRGVVGLFEDVDEARIPLWTLRTTYTLFDNWGPLSSGFLEGYVVPGSIDTTVSPFPIPKASPYSPPQDDPQALIAGLIPPSIAGPIVKGAFGGIQLGIYDHLPSRSMSNSRYGFRFGTVVARDYTTSIWYYRTISEQPVPRFLPLDISRAPILGHGGKGPTQLITEIHHGLENVFGGSTTWFSEPVNGIIRTEVEYFVNEPAFIPNVNIPFEAELRTPAVAKLLKGLGEPVSKGPLEGAIPRADFLRFELGYDRFFFFRPVNPYNSFTWVTAYVGQWNVTETFTDQNFRFGGQQKVTPTGTAIGANAQGLTLQTINKLHTVPTDFVDLYPYESFVQTHLQTDYMHGRLTPSVTAIVGLNGVYGFPFDLTYRYTDNLLFDLKYVLIGGNFYFPFGYFRDRSQLSARMTVLLN